MIPRAQQAGFRLALLVTIVAALGAPRASWAISPIQLGGALEGRVSDDSGQPQMGAVVQLFNHQDRLIERQLTDDAGFFVFAGLTPDVYSLRVTLATFLPAIRDQIKIQAGRSSLLDVNLSGLFSSIRLLPPSRRGDGIMNDDWKWILRSSSSTRPVFRYLPQDPTAIPATSSRSTLFSDSRGLVSLSAGDQNGGGSAGEVGTAFAFATSFRGDNQLEFAGDVGYGVSAEAPSAAVRTTFSRDFGGFSPEIALTMRQIYVPRWEGNFATGSNPAANLPAMRSMSVSVGDTTHVSDAITVQYGIQVDSIVFVDHIHYLSPYARLTYSLGDDGALDVTYTSGNARPELSLGESIDRNAELQRDVASLGSAAPVTLRSGAAQVQRGENYEIGYSRKLGSREVRVSGYRESVQNAALMLAGADGAAFAGDLIPDLYTDSLLFNAGNYHTMGYTAAVTQNVGDNYKITVMYGSVGVLAPRSKELTTESADELRALIRPQQREALTARIAGSVPRSGTQFAASYQIMDSHAATAGHLYATDSIEPDPGLNISCRQPIPMILGLPFRMEGTVELRNLLAEGYLPVSLPDGRQMLLVHTPRSLRGGLNFRF